MPETLALSKYNVTVVPKVYPVRATGLRPSQHFSRSPARGWTRAARCCLVLLACLAQLWMPAQHRHAPGFAAHSMVPLPPRLRRLRSRASMRVNQAFPARCTAPVPAPMAARPRALPPRRLPLLPCPLLPPVHAAIGILPHETARAAYAPPLSAIAAPPALLGSLARFAAFAGQPRAPPILI